MPTYSYDCNSCEATFEIQRSVRNYKSVEKCPFCQKKDKVTRNFGVDIVHTSVRLHLSEIKKLGHYADRQSEKYGKEKCAKIADSFVAKKREPGKLPEGATRLTEQDYINMPSRKRNKK